MQSSLTRSKSIFMNSNNSSPLYVLGSGSIGLMYAAYMIRSLASPLTVQKKEYDSPIDDVRLLLRSHHKSRLQWNDTQQPSCSSFPSFIKSTISYQHHHQKSCICTNIPAEVIDIDHGSTTMNTFTNNDSLFHTKNSYDTESTYIQNILLTTKAPDATAALQSILPRLHPTKPIHIIVMTNGVLAVIEDIQKMLIETLVSSSQSVSMQQTRQIFIYMASTTHGVYRTNDTGIYDIIHAGFGSTFVGKHPISITISSQSTIQNHDNNICNYNLSSNCNHSESLSIPQILHNILWNDDLLNTQLLNSHEMYILNWKKLATNCVVNPLTAIHQCKNGELLTLSNKNNSSSITRPSFTFKNKQNDSLEPQHLISEIIHEVSQVACLEAQSTFQNTIHDNSNDKQQQQQQQQSNKTIQDIIIDQLSYDNLYPFVLDVIHKTSNNQSSMLQDILSKRHPTEIEYLNGYVARLGREKYGLKNMWVNQLLCDEVNSLSHSLYYENH